MGKRASRGGARRPLFTEEQAVAPSLNINDLPECLLLEVGAQGPATPHGVPAWSVVVAERANNPFWLPACCSALSFEAHFGVRKL